MNSFLLLKLLFLFVDHGLAGVRKVVKNQLFLKSQVSLFRTSGRLVASPTLEACKNRPKHYMDKRTGHYYFFSGKSKFGALKVSSTDCVSMIVVTSCAKMTH